MDQLPLREPKVFNRWEKLPATEKLRIDQQAEQGMALSCLLVANDLLQTHPEQAAIALSKGISGRPYLRLHPFSLRFYLSRLIGRRLSSKLNSLGENIVGKYKRMRYSKRYHQKAQGLNE